MQSSNRMYKSSHTIGGEVSTEIHTKIMTETNLPKIKADDVQKTIRKTKKETEKILAQTESEKNAILSQAEQKAERLKEEAKHFGFKQGQEQGFEQGFQQGYQDAVQKVEAENLKMKENILLMIEKTKEELAHYQEDKKDEFIYLASQMAEKIVHKYIDESEGNILLLAEPYLNQLSRDEEFVTISVHPDKYSFLEENRERLQAFLPETRIVILQDKSLDQRGIFIESTRYTIDLQIKNQIEAMLREFEEMERTIDA